MLSGMCVKVCATKCNPLVCAKALSPYLPFSRMLRTQVIALGLAQFQSYKSMGYTDL